ncbi:YggS family pyridoxal phosphate-dependent enzyme [bacterium]|nr:YggS family pyridoxal phosphate-dependent enzyme [bacterium]
MLNAITERLNVINTQLEPYNPKIVAVTKYFDETTIIEYFKAGLRNFGENRVIDALKKISKLPDEVKNNSKFHLIGHLQTNKVKLAVGNFDLIHSVDSLKLAEAISNEAQRKGIIQDILLQINNAEEDSKFGFSVKSIYDCMAKLTALPSIKIQGLMNIAPLSQNEHYLRILFRDMNKLKNDLSLKFNIELKELSMGMSNDFRIAAEEGATIVRLGRILFKNDL